MQILSDKNPLEVYETAAEITYKAVAHKWSFKMCSPFIKMLFTNKRLNKKFKKLDR